ncbi:MAG: class I SAM-dependent methyltransferase [Tannerellaceae bacterium]|nr:class I SAM-dependent methyltransferase [Tannerellaceae bacterium]
MRIRNFDEICTILKTNFNVKTIVEVGCARGLFLKTAQQHGLIAEGIEPDAELSKEARQAGLAVYTNFFPDCNADTTP